MPTMGESGNGKDMQPNRRANGGLRRKGASDSHYSALSEYDEHEGVFRTAIDESSLAGKNSMGTGLRLPYLVRLAKSAPDVILIFTKSNRAHDEGRAFNRNRLTVFRGTVGSNIQGRWPFQTTSGTQPVLQSEVNPGTPNTHLLDPFFDLHPSRAVGIFNLGQGPHAANAFVDANTDSMRGNLFRFFRAGNREPSHSQGAEK